LAAVFGVANCGCGGIVLPACAAPAARPAPDAPTWTDAGLFVDEPVGEGLVVGGPVGEGLDVLLGGGDGLDDDGGLGDALDEWVGVPLADPLGAGEFVRQLSDACGDELAPGPVDWLPPVCEPWCADRCVPFEPDPLV